MNPYLALYIKELKALRLVGAVLIVATVALVAWVLCDATDGGVHASMALLLGPYLCPPVLAGLLIHSISQEWSTHTQHQWLALPVPRAVLLLAKVAAVVTIGAGVFAINTFGWQMIQAQILAAIGDTLTINSHHGLPPFDQLSGSDLWGGVGSVFGAVTVLLLGLALAASSLRMIVPHFRGLVTPCVFLGGMWLTIHLGPEIVGAGGQQLLPRLYAVYGYVAAMGVVFGVAGAAIFDRFADA